ncbi:hypothetical protein Abr02nite_39020 [Paractinoplanes brasiliensis]|nr:hypothetical protein Abr02nite_39020 [Actinoplanes brasiliensis]
MTPDDPRPEENQGSVNMQYAVNGIPAGQLEGVTWQKSRRSNPSGNCVECAVLPNGEVAMRNSRDPEGPALIYTRAEIEAFLGGVHDGDFDNLLA